MGEAGRLGTGGGRVECGVDGRNCKRSTCTIEQMDKMSEKLTKLHENQLP